MQIGMIGLGRMGSNMARRLLADGHECVVFDRSREAVEALHEFGAAGAASSSDLVARLSAPRVIWLMIPAAAVDAAIDELCGSLAEGDVIVDGANSHYVDDMRRAKALRERGIDYVDAGVSGGVWGLEEGYCLMVGGDAPVVDNLSPIFKSLARAPNAISAQRDAAGSTASQGYLHCGPGGAGHFVKMVHNGIEYGLMAAYAEGLNLLANASAGSAEHGTDAETAPLGDAERYRFDFDLAAICELWRHGSVIRSWLLDLTASALQKDADLEAFRGEVSDSGEGRWTLQSAIDVGVPTPVLAAALFERFSSRGNDDFANRVLSAMRYAFGGHLERPAAKP